MLQTSVVLILEAVEKIKKKKNLAQMNNQYIMINIQNWSPWQQPLPSQAEN